MSVFLHARQISGKNTHGGILTFGYILRDQLSRLADEQHGAYSDHEGAYFEEDGTRNLG